jgi:hypothetical protein
MCFLRLLSRPFPAARCPAPARALEPQRIERTAVGFFVTDPPHRVTRCMVSPQPGLAHCPAQILRSPAVRWIILTNSFHGLLSRALFTNSFHELFSRTLFTSSFPRKRSLRNFHSPNLAPPTCCAATYRLHPVTEEPTIQCLGLVCRRPTKRLASALVSIHMGS